MALSTLLQVFNCLGLPVAIEKLEGPTSCLTFLGFQLDSNRMEVRLPHPKLVELLELLQSWVGRRTCRRRELESLVGKLAHASTVVKPGRTFLRRMFELLSGTRKAFYHVRLGLSFQSDLLWWLTFAEAWNGIALIQKLPPERSAYHIWSDASGSFGCGAVDPASQRWFQFQWPQRYLQQSSGIREECITLQELLPIVMACAIWGNQWRGSTVTVHCDNTGAVAVVNSGYSRAPRIMHLLRCLFFIRAYFEISLWAVHVPGIQNGWADAISRDNLSYFFSQVPGAVDRQEVIPHPLVQLLVEQSPDWTSRAWIQLFRRCFQPA